MITNAKKVFLDFVKTQFFFSPQNFFFLAQDFFYCKKKLFLQERKSCGKKKIESSQIKKKFRSISKHFCESNSKLYPLEDTCERKSFMSPLLATTNKTYKRPKKILS